MHAKNKANLYFTKLLKLKNYTQIKFYEANTI